MFSLRNMQKSDSKSIINLHFPKQHEISSINSNGMYESTESCNTSFEPENTLSNVDSSEEVIYFSRQFANRFRIVSTICFRFHHDFISSGLFRLQFF